ncbi:hypothetical protein FCH33_09395 [Serratia fonticola]|uniref:hypothetical protein n=1 Tax=Serratia fonticola TaxID=47917 RepID=UPI0015757C55|nr:hypothetical protein [Serratia fonticola]NTY86995.1 hypothetical protein [Serratia fonticola]NTZ15122.1 hypothetical protein [Serratia fonticola]CAI1873754.1 Uncharacterised protein [Serratia fonticola]
MEKLATLAVVGIVLLAPWTAPQAVTPVGPGFTPERPASLFDCQTPLVKLLASSNQALIRAEKVPADKLEINIEPRANGIQAIQLFDSRKPASPDSPGAGHLGWVMYDPQTGQLLDNSADEQHPQPLTFNPQYGKQYQQCLQKEQRCAAILDQMKLGAIIADSPKYVVRGKGRAYFHVAPTEQCVNESQFVIPDDKVQVVGYAALEPVEGEKNGYLLVGYGNASGWINVDRLAPLDEICHDAQASAESAISKTASPAAKYLVKSKKLYFYDSPDKLCQDEGGKFVVNGDSVAATHGQAYKGFLFVSYLHPKTGDKTTGWVKTNGLTAQ